MHNVFHFDAAQDFGQEMLVVPKCVRPVALFIGEIGAGFYMRDFGDPLHADAQNGRNRVMDDLSREHLSVVAR